MLSFKEEVLKMKLQSVEEFFHKRETVEKYNVDKIIKLNWECPDVLFSFRGVYAIGKDFPFCRLFFRIYTAHTSVLSYLRFGILRSEAPLFQDR